MRMMRRNGGVLVGAVVGVLVLFGCGSSGSADNEMPNPGGSGGNVGGASNTGGNPTGEGGTSANSGGSSGMAAGGSSGGAASQAGTAGAGGGATVDNFEPEFEAGFCIPKGPQLEDVPGVEVIFSSNRLGGTYLPLVVHDGWFYWATNLDSNGAERGIRRRAPGANQDEMVVSDVFARSMVVTDTHVYWMENNNPTLMRASLAQLPATPEEIVTGFGQPVLVDEQNIIFNGISGVFILPLAEAVPGGGAMPTEILPSQSTTLSLNGDELLYVDAQTVFGVPIAGGTPRAIMTLGGVSEVLAASDTLFAIARERIVKRSIEGMEMTTPLAMANLLGATDARLDLQHLRLEGDRLYYRETTGDIAWVKTDGSDCRSIARMTEYSDPQDNRWVMDETHIYIIQTDQRLLKIPK
ncbi:MAG TPA: hypothetical protein VHO25_14005 [Polyangiaceae bacterium]|nr:hypothetical protein [Polyangiaceae bacterium]